MGGSELNTRGYDWFVPTNLAVIVKHGAIRLKSVSKVDFVTIKVLKYEQKMYIKLKFLNLRGLPDFG